MKRTKGLRSRRGGSIGYWRNKCDALWSERVRTNAVCASDREKHAGVMQAAHIISRRYMATRWDLDNGLALCQGCHMYYTEHPVEWELFLEKKVGREKYEELRTRATLLIKRIANDLKIIADGLKT